MLDETDDTLVIAGILVVLFSNGLILLRSDGRNLLPNVLLVLLVDALLILIEQTIVLGFQIMLRLLESKDGKSGEANLAKKVFLGGVRFMEEETQVQAVDIDHDSLDLPKVG